MNKTIGSLPLWQFTLLLVVVLATFTVVVNTINKNKKAA